MRRRTSDKSVSFTIAIVGGGFSGTTLASELLFGGNPAIKMVLIEREGCPGRGVAYGTHFPGHLLNVTAQNMSARANDPLHFLRWAREHY
ncbi:MAG TPA: FAD/NAD(P)-binding protein, partial [Terriglobales bacterium]|nr:FAD/NAD(P)-binding protein [Terriglobales bacterium]